MQDAPDAVTFRLSQRKARNQLLLSAGAGLFIAVVMYNRDQGPMNAIDKFGLTCIAVLFVWLMLSNYEKGMMDRSPQLVFDREGLRAPGIFAFKLPWSAIRTYEIIDVRGNPTALELDVVQPDRFGPSRSHPANWILVGSSRFRLEIDGMDGSVDDIVAAMERFWRRSGAL